MDCLTSLAMPRVLTTFAEKNEDDYEIVPVDFSVGAQIAESRAIARYVAEKFEGKGTAVSGKTAKEKALVNRWLEVKGQNYNPIVHTIVFHLVYGPMVGLKPVEAVVKEQLGKLEKLLDINEAHLSENKYLAGEFFSMAGLSHIPFTSYLINEAKKGDAVTCRKHVNAWWKTISSRPSWKKVTALWYQPPKQM
ncbi:unnamed protein product [Sphagnum compactum]